MREFTVRQSVDLSWVRADDHEAYTEHVRSRMRWDLIDRIAEHFGSMDFDARFREERDHVGTITIRALVAE